MMQTKIVDLAEMRHELQCKQSKIAELTSIVLSKETVIADMENYKVSYSTLVNYCATIWLASDNQMYLKEDNFCAMRQENLHADLEEMARQLQSKDYNILKLRSQVQLKGLEVADLERKLKVSHV